jgi:HSP20 family protein
MRATISVGRRRWCRDPIRRSFDMSMNRHVAWSMPREVEAFRHAFGRFLGPDADDAPAVTSGRWAPAVDVREEERRFVILADVPGVDPAAIEVSMDKGVLTIQGERVAAEGAAVARFSRRERVHGAFLRRFSLPDSADAEGIVANGRNGVLEISIPKKAESAPRRIVIDTGH